MLFIARTFALFRTFAAAFPMWSGWHSCATFFFETHAWRPFSSFFVVMRALHAFTMNAVELVSHFHTRLIIVITYDVHFAGVGVHLLPLGTDPVVRYRVVDVIACFLLVVFEPIVRELVSKCV